MIDPYEKLLPLYTEHQENLRLRMPFVDHQFNYYMKVEACNWFQKQFGIH